MEDDGVPVEDLLKLKLTAVGNQSTGKSCILNNLLMKLLKKIIKPQ